MSDDAAIGLHAEFAHPICTLTCFPMRAMFYAVTRDATFKGAGCCNGYQGSVAHCIQPRSLAAVASTHCQQCYAEGGGSILRRSHRSSVQVSAVPFCPRVRLARFAWCLVQRAPCVRYLVFRTNAPVSRGAHNGITATACCCTRYILTTFISRSNRSHHPANLLQAEHATG